MRVLRDTSMTRWSIALLLFGMVWLPFGQVVQATSMHPMDHMMEMGEDCDDGVCASESAQESCLEHCLRQVGAIQTTAQSVSSVRGGELIAILELIEVPYTPFQKRSTVQGAHPPKSGKRLLTIQKRE